MSEKNPADPTPSEGGGRDIYVGDYEGDRAGDAATSVRRHGLKPLLRRVEGYDPKMQGLVVFQTPRPGNPAAPGSTVGLFIAAPPSPPVSAAGERLAGTGPTPSPQPEKPDAEAELGDIEELWVEEGSHQDATIEIYELTSPAARANVERDLACATDAEEGDGVKASIPLGTAGVWRGSPSARHSLRETIAGQLNTGVLLVWREALLLWWREHQPLWQGRRNGLAASALAGLIVLLAVTHHAPSAPRPVMRAQTPGRRPVAPRHLASGPKPVMVPKGCRHARRQARHLPSRAVPVMRVMRSTPAIPPRVSAPVVQVRETTRPAVTRGKARAGAAEREFGF